MSDTTGTNSRDDVQTTIVDETHTSPTFAELGVHDSIVEALADDGKTHTFAIQELTLPLALSGDDLIGQARTGMGKTYGFGVPMMHRLATAEASGLRPLDNTPRALVIVPTRELCLQVTGDLEVAAKKLDVTLADGTTRPLKITSIYGGRPYESQIADLKSGVDLVVGTPGRLLDLAQQGHLILGKVGVLVLDEADEMLDLGFLPDIERIMAALPTPRQTMLFSATMPKQMEELSRAYLNNPKRVQVSPPGKAADKITQSVHFLDKTRKGDKLREILSADRDALTLVFGRTKHGCEKLMKSLVADGYNAASIHGNKSQGQRDRAIKAFRDGTTTILVATDVAARGIDIPGVAYVINHDLPETPDNYVHRIGRTARAGREGEAISLCSPEEVGLLGQIEKLMKIDIPVASGSRPAASEAEKPGRRGGGGRGRGRGQGKPQSAGKPGGQARRRRPRRAA